jgi:hypothetical protein
LTQIALPGATRRVSVLRRSASTIIPIALGSLLAIVGVLLMANAQSMEIAYPVIAMILIAAVFSSTLTYLEDGGLPFFEIGFFFVAIVSLYGVYAMVTAIALDLRFTPLSDVRLWTTQPSAQELAETGWMHVGLVGVFSLAYLAVRRKTPPPARLIARPNTSMVVILVGLYICIKLFFFFLITVYGLRFDTYQDEYLAYRAVPLIFAQLANHLGGMTNTIQLLLLFSLFTSYRKNKPIIMLWIGVATVMTFLKLGSRTELFLLLLSAVIVYHRLIKPLSGRTVLLLAIVALGGFVVLGLLRIINGGGSAGLGSATEFDTLFANAFDLLRRKKTEGILDPPKTLYYNDFLALIPQQFIPFIKKADNATWYLRTYYPDMYDAGAGYAFGLISEAIIGRGWPDLIARSALLGAAYGGLHRWFVFRKQTVWTFAMYTWVTAIAYQSYRASTFAPMIYLWFRFLPIYVLVTLLIPMVRAALVSGKRAAPRSSPDALA